MLRLALAVAMTLGAASAAFAQAPIMATLSTPVAKPAEVLAGETLWQCAEKGCLVRTRGADSESWLECRKLVLSVGKVTAYGTLDDSKLAMCNAAAKK
jgi:hypothetical protein